MAYLCKDKDTREKIKECINEYVTERGMSPSIRDIAAGTGISRSMVQRYMAAMREEGEIDYGRRDIETDFTRKIERDTVIVSKLSSSDEGEVEEYFSVPRAWLGEGSFSALEVEDDSMSGVGVNGGDIVIFREGDDFEDGDIVAASLDGLILLRRAYHRAGRVLLTAENSRYSDKTPREVDVLGVAVKHIRSFGDIPAKKKEEESGKSSLQVFLL
jgi:SOS-response transcriptional repressor LexA